MSDHFVTLVIKNTTEANIDRDSEKILKLLFADGLISDPSSDELTFKPGTKFELIQQEADRRILELISNEVKILKGRQIFSEMEGAEFWLTCRQCKKVFDGFQSPVIQIIDSFHQNGNEIFKCTACEFEENLRLADTKGFAAGFLAVEFNNWGSIKEEFILKLQQELTSTILVIEGHI